MKFQRIREDKDMNQKEIANLLNIGLSTYQRYERGELKIYLDTSIELAKFYGVSIDYIAGLTNDKKGLTKSQLSEDVSQLVKTYETLSDRRKGRLEQFMQQSHIKALYEYLHLKYQYFTLEEKFFKSLIIFSGKAEFKKIPNRSESYQIINNYELNNYINHENETPQIFTESQLDELYNILLPTTQVSDEIKQKHIENVKKYQIKHS